MRSASSFLISKACFAKRTGSSECVYCAADNASPLSLAGPCNDNDVDGRAASSATSSSGVVVAAGRGGMAGVLRRRAVVASARRIMLAS